MDGRLWIKNVFNGFYFAFPYFRFSPEVLKNEFLLVIILNFSLNILFILMNIYVPQVTVLKKTIKFLKLLPFVCFRSRHKNVSQRDLKTDKHLSNQIMRKDGTMYENMMFTMFCLVRQNFRSSQEVQKITFGLFVLFFIEK